MPLSDAAAELLRTILKEREALVDRATDKVFFESPDLHGKRSRLVTRMLVDRVFGCSEGILLRGEEAELDVFIDQVTGIRAEADFHVSTLIFGFRSFRHAIEDRIRALAGDVQTAWELLCAVDDLYARSAARAADLLVERQLAALSSRRAHVERENVKLAAELRTMRDMTTTMRAELDAAALATLRFEQEIRDKTATIWALTESDPRVKEILELFPPGPRRLDAVRELRREQMEKLRSRSG